MFANNAWHIISTQNELDRLPLDEGIYLDKFYFKLVSLLFYFSELY